MPLSSQTSIPKTPPPEHYTGMDDILIPDPGFPFDIRSEYFPFGVVGKDNDGQIEIATQVYIESTLFEQATTTHSLADRWIELHSKNESKLELLGRRELRGNEGIVQPIVNDKGEVISAPYTFSIETQGANLLSGQLMNDHDQDYRNRQVFRLYPLSAYQIFSVRIVRETQYFKSHPMFAKQYGHFLRSLQPAVATLQSTLAGNTPLTRRFYTAHFNFDTPIPAKYKGNNQWPIDHVSKRADEWHLPEGDLVVTYEIQSGYDFLPKHENAKLKSDIKGLVDNLPGYLKSIEPNKSVPEMRYIEVPFGEYAMYGSVEHKSSYASIELSTANKKGKVLVIHFSGSPALIKKYESTLLAWVTHIKVMQ